MSKQDPFFNPKKQSGQKKPKSKPPAQFKRKKGGQILNEGSGSPIPKGGRGGKIQTNWKPIDWTPKTFILVSILIGAPYLAGIIASLWIGFYFITIILIGLGLLVAVLAAILRWLDQAEF